jgi:bacterial leucyl aminopeptidase
LSFICKYAAMKFSKTSVLAACAPLVAARFIETTEGDNANVILHPEELEEFLIETAPGEVKWVTEEEKWELRRVCIDFVFKCRSHVAWPFLGKPRS